LGTIPAQCRPGGLVRDNLQYKARAHRLRDGNDRQRIARFQVCSCRASEVGESQLARSERVVVGIS
jgi:hypothetical protein